MFRHTSMLPFEVKPEKPDAWYARKLQELIGGALGEMTVTRQYPFQGWNWRMEGKYKGPIMDTEYPQTARQPHWYPDRVRLCRSYTNTPSDNRCTRFCALVDIRLAWYSLDFRPELTLSCATLRRKFGGMGLAKTIIQQTDCH